MSTESISVTFSDQDFQRMAEEVAAEPTELEDTLIGIVDVAEPFCEQSAVLSSDASVKIGCLATKVIITAKAPPLAPVVVPSLTLAEPAIQRIKTEKADPLIRDGVKKVAEYTKDYIGRSSCL